VSADPLPDWYYGPEGRGWTVDDLDRLPPEAPRRLEIIDGGLVAMSPQSMFHLLAITEIENGLRSQAPDNLIVAREWTVALPDGDGPEPDVVVFNQGAYRSEAQTRVEAKHVRLVVEVVSPSSRKRDLVRKPQLYADAGIEHYWIVERKDASTVVREHQFRSSGGYALVSTQHDQFATVPPFPVELDLSPKALDL
jgi:Uma2 family endonuclease